MMKDELLGILNEWNFWNQKRDVGIKRPFYLEKMKDFSQTGQVVVLSGARRSGKSTLMLQYTADLIAGGLDAKNTLYINFEDSRFSGELTLALLQQIYDVYRAELAPDTPNIFIDEIQLIPGWERFVRAIHERKEATLFVSGSNAQMLSDEFGASLTGRHLMIEVFPLDFSEFLAFHDIYLKNNLEIVSKKGIIQKFFEEYLLFGGFPKVVLSQEKQEILRQYFDDVLARDIVGRYHVRNTVTLKALAQYYETNISSLMTYSSVRKFLKTPLATVQRFSGYYTYAYLIFFVKKFAYSLKEQEVNPRKVYSIDTGLRNAVSGGMIPDKGKLYENCVYLELLRKHGNNVFYWSDKVECDFVVKESDGMHAYQVVYAMSHASTREREFAGLASALKSFDLKEGVIVTGEEEGLEEYDGKIIHLVPLWKWLLGFPVS
ncbi:MAG: ATP-binding protein [bacterium]|nr:ATP-binding protein [bacterium]